MFCQVGYFDAVFVSISVMRCLVEETEWKRLSWVDLREGECRKLRLQRLALGDGFLPCLSEAEEEKEAAAVGPGRGERGAADPGGWQRTRRRLRKAAGRPGLQQQRAANDWPGCRRG